MLADREDVKEARAHFQRCEGPGRAAALAAIEAAERLKHRPHGHRK
jgi:hypothetical protein